MKLVGLTGGISTGKSSVSCHLATYQIPIIDADSIARQVVSYGTPAYKQIIRNFGTAILNSDGCIDRKKLGSIIFNDSTKRHLLESITHPFIILEMARIVLIHFILFKRIIVLDTPLLYEAKLDRWMSQVWVVYCRRGIQIERLMKRDKIDENTALSRINSQMSLEAKKNAADVVIDNSDDIRVLHNQVDKLLATRTPGFLSTALYWTIGVVPACLVYLCLETYLFLKLKGW